MKKILSFVLSTIMILSCLAIIPFTAAAANEDVYTEGEDGNGNYVWNYNFLAASSVAGYTPQNGGQMSTNRHTNGMQMGGTYYWYDNIPLKNLTEEVTIEYKVIYTSKGAIRNTVSFGNGTDLVQVEAHKAPAQEFTKTFTYNPQTGVVTTWEEKTFELELDPETRVLQIRIDANGGNVKAYIRSLTVTQKMANEPVEPEVPAIDPVCTMRVGGHQTSVVDENGKYNVRFVGVISDLPAGSEKVGFEIKAPAFDKTWENLSTNTVYYSLKANFGAETITAEECGGKYITAAAITGIPADVGAIEFVVTPYVIFTIDEVETKIYGEPETVSDVHPSVAE